MNYNNVHNKKQKIIARNWFSKIKKPKIEKGELKNEKLKKRICI